MMYHGPDYRNPDVWEPCEPAVPTDKMWFDTYWSYSRDKGWYRVRWRCKPNGHKRAITGSVFFTKQQVESTGFNIVKLKIGDIVWREQQTYSS